MRNTQAFAVRMRPLVRETVYEDIRAGRCALAEQLDGVLAVTPADPLAHVYYGDLYRQRARSADDRNEKAQKPLASYQRPLDLDLDQPVPRHQLGVLHYQ